MMPWRAFLARAGAASGLFGLAMFAAIRLATADPGGPTTSMLTYAGVLHGVSTARMATLTFTFTKPGAAPCAVEVRDVPIAAGGAFTAGVSIASCPSYFDGSNVTYTVAEGRDILTPDGGVAITPVPYARFADQVGVNNDCPAGYERNTTDPGFEDRSDNPRRLCQRHRTEGGARVIYDEVVRVGTGASAFWIDRYEATMWQAPDGSRGFGDSPYVPFGTGTAPDYPSGFQTSGQWAVPVSPASAARIPTRLYALSRTEPPGTTIPERFIPSRFITWFQAQTACRASGKRLPSGDEWLEAAVGSDDGGGTSDGADGRCVTNATGIQRFRGRSSTTRNCLSWWGAQDMIGNVFEWTADWYAGVGQVTSTATLDRTMVRGSRVNDFAQPWPAGYNNDATWNISSVVGRSPLAGDDNVVGMPAAAIRGGAWNSQAGAGVFALGLFSGPSSWDPNVGFRCVVPR